MEKEGSARYGKLHYGRTEMVLPKRIKAKLEEAVKERGMSRNEYIVTAIKEKYIRDIRKRADAKKE